MEIIWSDNATYTFYNNRSYLLHYWNSEVAQKFVDNSLHTISLIKQNPHLGKYIEDLECNEILVSKHISLLYEINEDLIILLTFWDNHKKNKHF